MTQEEEAEDIITNYCLAHDDSAVHEAVTRMMEWFDHWKDR